MNLPEVFLFRGLNLKDKIFISQINKTKLNKIHITKTRIYKSETGGAWHYMVKKRTLNDWE